jgi:hypothetical protein
MPTASDGRPDNIGSNRLTVAVIDGPFDAAGLSGILAERPISVGEGAVCATVPGSACAHGTFTVGLLGARPDAPVPGLCPNCKLLHVPLFSDGEPGGATVGELADAISAAVDAGARLINLSLAVVDDEGGNDSQLAAALDRAQAAGAVVVVAAGNRSSSTRGQLLAHPVTVPVAMVDHDGRLLAPSNMSADIVRRSVAVRGNGVRGYGPGGRIAQMSGTSAAAAVVTGTLGALWSVRRGATAADIQAAIGILSRKDRRTPAIIDDKTIAAALDLIARTKGVASSQATPHIDVDPYKSLEGGSVMQINNGTTRSSVRGAPAQSSDAETVALSGDVGMQGGPCTCSNCVAGPPVYVIGTIDVRFPDLALENEIDMLVRDLSLPAGQISDQAWLADVLSRDEARYITRELCWVLTVEGQDAYILKLRDERCVGTLIESLRHPRRQIGTFAVDSVVVVGEMGPYIDICDVNRPLLVVDRISTTTLTAPPPSPTPRRTRKSQAPTAPPPVNPNFQRLVRWADNFGHTDGTRAINYLIARYEQLYSRLSDREQNGFNFDNIEVRESRLIGKRRIVDPVITFRNGTNGVERYFIRVDVTHKYPMHITDIEPYA